MDGVDQSPLAGLFRVHYAGCIHYFSRESQAAEAGKALRTAPAGNNAQIDLRLAEARILSAKPDVTGQRHLTTAPQGKAVDGRYHRLRNALDGGGNHLSQLYEGAGLLRGHILHLGDCLLYTSDAADE